MCVTHFTGWRDFGASSPRLGCFLGWLFWSVVHIYFLITVRDRFIVAFTWLWDYVTFQRGARLITEVPPAKRK
jgi:NADH dehydrogenase FAD-containing subunit